MNPLKHKISEYINNEDLNPTSFSRKADISPGIVSNIMSSENANPTIDTALKIAKIMNCSLDELFNRDHIPENMTLDQSLMHSVCDFLSNLEEMNDKTLGDFCNIIKYIYGYCKENSLKEVDKNFTKWYINKIYHQA